MAQIIAFQSVDSIHCEAKEILIERRWWRSVARVAALQPRQTTMPHLCRFLEEPCAAICTDDGEMALAFGAPPLILRSSDVEFLSAIRDDVQRLRRLRFYAVSDWQRDRLAQMHRAALLLIDALEHLSTGLRHLYPAREITLDQRRVGGHG